MRHATCAEKPSFLGRLALHAAWGVGLVFGAAAPVALGQETIYRCANGYTHLPSSQPHANCQPLGSNRLSVVNSVPLPTQAAPAGADDTKTPAQQLQADATRQQLQAQLQAAQQQQAQLRQAYNHGAPEKEGSESRNHQKYLERVAALQESLAQSERTVRAISRELSRYRSAHSAD
jgi:hypothetical protein